MKLAISSVLFALPLALIACGGDDGGVTLIDGGDIDATGGGPDACVSAKPSAPGKAIGNANRGFSFDLGPVEHGGCQATADYGAATIGQAQASADFADPCVTNVPPEFIGYQGTLNADASPDVLDIELYKGFGVFTTGEIRTGTYTITGDEANYATCGVCVLLLADVNTTSGAPGSLYMATGGTVNITSVSPNITGTLSNMTFVHVDIDSTTFQSTPNADNCPSAITSLSFDALVEI